MQNIDGNKENTKGRRFPLYLLCLILAVAAAAGLITSYCLRKDLQAQEKSSGIVIEANASGWNPGASGSLRRAVLRNQDPRIWRYHRSCGYEHLEDHSGKSPGQQLLF